MTLDDRLLDAHGRGDRAFLVTLYAQAADQSPDTDTACFYLTQAYVFALELGHPAQAALYQRLKSHNRV